MLTAMVVNLAPAGAWAQTLLDAIQMAYQTNPSLQAQRAQLQVVDEGYVQARAGWGPQVSVSGQYGYDGASVPQAAGLFSPASTNDFSAGSGLVNLSLSQPLYTGGVTRAEVRAAAANILASRQALRQTESQILQNVVTAYEDVLRDRRGAQVLRGEIEALAADVQETDDRGAVGAVTRTDKAQAEARLLAARSQLVATEGRLNISTAEFTSVVGENPGELQPEPDLPGLPTTPDEAFAVAERNNPQLLNAMETERAAREKVVGAKAANRPTVSIKVNADVTPVEPYLPHPYEQNVSAVVTVSQPLFTSGLYGSKVREALAGDNQAMFQIVVARRAAIQAVAQAWDQLMAAREANVIAQRQVETEEAASKGERIEERAGLRPTIELLNQEAELAAVRLTLIQGRHDEYVARAALLAAMGMLELGRLAPNAQLYDPAKSLKSVEGRGSAPWAGLVGRIDGLGAPSDGALSLPPSLTSAERPASAPLYLAH